VALPTAAAGRPIDDTAFVNRFRRMRAPRRHRLMTSNHWREVRRRQYPMMQLGDGTSETALCGRAPDLWRGVSLFFFPDGSGLKLVLAQAAARWRCSPDLDLAYEALPSEANPDCQRISPGRQARI